MNLASILLAAVSRDPHRPALKLGDRTVSYAELDDASARCAGYLRKHGVAPGDRVALMLPNVPEFAVLYYGILRAGAVVVPMNPLLKPREVDYYLEDSGAKGILAWHTTEQAAVDRADGLSVAVTPDGLTDLLAAYEPVTGLVERDGDETAVILYTSGTTGQPKGAELTHDNLCRNVEVSNATLLGLGGGDVMFGALPLFHSFGQTIALNCAVAAGATLTLLPRFDAAQALEILVRDRATVFAGVPTMYAALLAAAGDDQPDLSALRTCVSGGAALPVELLRRFEEKFGCVILEGYGLSETSPVASFNHPDRPRKPGSIGTPIDGVEMDVRTADGAPAATDEVGEIVIRGHNVMKGYWRRPEATAEAIVDGWFRTGDLGARDADGYYRIVDRTKDLVIRGGFNVYPREVEEVLYEHPAVAEAAVLGMPYPTLGEEVVAVVALRPGADADPAELREYVKGQLAAYKYPRQVWIVPALPKGPTGKILKRSITVPPPAAG
ncbi:MULTISPECIES: long-chain fatty acid--CoA ligase [Micromonospora]|uniref:Long-chain fatty acid--CoA ligase n=1 Tax=Micromonospora solifontis TaxID=2487138 RepID=A0ABX9WFL1_9ACTN|nr:MULTISPECIES: long-chain fatty acid--CoA ligase [Micromonospora]NES16173.1 long-chain fatty acid--CoA ligase [Micromonospora sp. PPF5-17B]NES38026.1 long-chain fatty acid--CoA ligase [Micromonospora solifontis]NES57660.1 long-chain fatty acid--CoA ligase [Micromonospora sp. PPF5-6]RNL97705.1 long-chain fatty acid--CoA ligase [Micromonospora solifontis]